MQFLNIVKDKSKFRESLDYFKKHKEYLESNPFYKEYYEENKNSHAQEVNTYEDLVLLYLNCK